MPSWGHSTKSPFPNVHLLIYAFPSMSFPLHNRPRTPGDSTKKQRCRHFPTVGRPYQPGDSIVLFGNDVDIYQRIPITFRVRKCSEQTCSEISVARTDESSSYLYLRIRMVTKAPFTKLWFPTTNFLGWCVDLHGRFPYTRGGRCADRGLSNLHDDLLRVSSRTSGHVYWPFGMSSSSSRMWMTIRSWLSS